MYLGSVQKMAASRIAAEEFAEHRWVDIAIDLRDWGDDPKGGVDLRAANKLSFWTKGANGGEKIRFFVGGIGTGTDMTTRDFFPLIC